MAPPAKSAITMALASHSPSIGISAHSGVKAQTFVSSGMKHVPGLPPTPPNSISPNLPANVVRADLSSLPVHIEDLDLQDAVDHAKAQDLPPVPLSKGALSGLETAQAITPSMLARDYLPDIILGHGPMAIRHVMGCLTQSVPGFSRIPPAKARRVVVAALENRAGGGSSGAVEFEKVGWGRWDAHIKGQKHLSRSSYTESRLSPPSSESSGHALSQSGSAYPVVKYFKRTNNHGHGSSMPSVDEVLDDMSMSEHEVDNMSLDGSETDDSTSDSAGDETEPEDWAAMGADALRKSSIPTAASGGVRRNYNRLCIPGPIYNRRLSSTSSRRSSQQALARSAPGRPTAWRKASASSHSAQQFLNIKPNVSNDNGGGSTDTHQTSQEREAVQALLSMGSM